MWLSSAGVAFISVPDLEVLAKVFLNKDKLSHQERLQVVRVMYGGQVDPYDFHLSGFDDTILTAYLHQVRHFTFGSPGLEAYRKGCDDASWGCHVQAGFCEVRRVGGFGLFNDSSSLELWGHSISLNMMATACKEGHDLRPRISVALPTLT